jgi:hypothetical protein
MSADARRHRLVADKDTRDLGTVERQHTELRYFERPRLQVGSRPAASSRFVPARNGVRGVLTFIGWQVPRDT